MRSGNCNWEKSNVTFSHGGGDEELKLSLFPFQSCQQTVDFVHFWLRRRWSIDWRTVSEGRIVRRMIQNRRGSSSRHARIPKGRLLRTGGRVAVAGRLRDRPVDGHMCLVGTAIWETEIAGRRTWTLPIPGNWNPRSLPVNLVFANRMKIFGKIPNPFWVVDTDRWYSTLCVW
jgi:hypothetical protein